MYFRSSGRLYRKGVYRWRFELCVGSGSFEGVHVCEKNIVFKNINNTEFLGILKSF